MVSGLQDFLASSFLHCLTLSVGLPGLCPQGPGMCPEPEQAASSLVAVDGRSRLSSYVTLQDITESCRMQKCDRLSLQSSVHRFFPLGKKEAVRSRLHLDLTREPRPPCRAPDAWS